MLKKPFVMIMKKAADSILFSGKALKRVNKLEYLTFSSCFCCDTGPKCQHGSSLVLGEAFPFSNSVFVFWKGQHFELVFPQIFDMGKYVLLTMRAMLASVMYWPEMSHQCISRNMQIYMLTAYWVSILFPQSAVFEKSNYTIWIKALKWAWCWHFVCVFDVLPYFYSCSCLV